MYLFLFLQMQFHWCLFEVLQSTSLTTREPLRISMMSKTQRLVKAPLAACAGPHLNARFFGHRIGSGSYEIPPPGASTSPLEQRGL